MNVGVRAHDYGRHTIREMAELLRRRGFSCAQLVLPKAFEEIGGYDEITLPLIDSIRKHFEEAGIRIAVFGCYMDLGNPDDVVRERAVETVKRCLAFNKELGAGVVASETAYPHLSEEEKRVWRPFVHDSLERIAEEAARLDTRMAVEAAYWHPVDSPEMLRSVLDRLHDPEHIGVIFDAANVLAALERTDQTAYWTEWLEKIGSSIDVLHIKDFVSDSDGTYVPKALGKGVIDYAALRRWIHSGHDGIPLIREEMDPRNDGGDIAFLRNF
ncbi:sugar phosphate isomerase/epimerase family protein [Lachnoclostridium sp. Marseille-P6806]|uniref:sugar phosphate isomerase/epimerase family protein n=1 Tax=Lachnoclostridium sp. Marseille-P6806 TaxID=2364793 RepID=UPI00102FEAAB|nr:sugar phosphate isomerase/epimerase family protein [Lachnoclostridium sp. Marseille-P6806]